MWVIQSAVCEDAQEVFFYYDCDRNGDIAVELLKRYRGYEKVDGIKRSLCLANIRQYYIASIPLDGNGKELTGSKGAEGREYVNLLFKVEDRNQDLPYEEKKQRCQKRAG